MDLFGLLRCENFDFYVVNDLYVKIWITAIITLGYTLSKFILYNIFCYEIIKSIVIFPSNRKQKFSTLWSILKDALDSSKEVFTVVECIHAKHKENSREGAQLTKPIAINVEPVDWKNVLILLWTKMVSAKSISLLSQRLM